MNPRNVSLSDFKAFLIHLGCKEIRHHKGHIVFSHTSATRPIVLQDHIDPVPLHVVKSNLRTLNKTLNDLRNFIS
jgi:hypothetical protein